MWWFLIFTLFAEFEGNLSLEITSIDVPLHVQLGHTTKLTCNYNLGTDSLYSVKWYKGKYEFYRYVPKDEPPGQVFKLDGIQVNQTISNNHQVVLENVGLAASGTYRCEVSAEAPSFQTVSKLKEMLVVDPPDEGPKIIGALSRYQVGDNVQVNCSTKRSSPAATLVWYINGNKAIDGILRVYPPIRDVDGLESSTLGLEFRVTDYHFSNGSLTLRCSASIQPFYSVSNEHSVHERLEATEIKTKEVYSQVEKNSQSERQSTVGIVLKITFSELFIFVIKRLID